MRWLKFKCLFYPVFFCNEALQGVPIPLFPWNISLYAPVPQNQILDFLCSLFPKIAFVPLPLILDICSPEINALVPLFLKIHGRASVITLLGGEGADRIAGRPAVCMYAILWFSCVSALSFGARRGLRSLVMTIPRDICIVFFHSYWQTRIATRERVTTTVYPRITRILVSKFSL